MWPTMPQAIGDTLREARMRQKIDISEIESKTKIRAKYLRAMENEEFDLLPGSTFAKSFLRTYANALGLDSHRLVEEYRAQYEPRDEGDLPPLAGQRGRRPPPQRRHRRSTAARPRRVSLRITPSVPTYMCVDRGLGTTPIYQGITAQAQTFKGRHIRVNLGKTSVTIVANGKTVPLAASPNPAGLDFTPRTHTDIPVGQ